MQKETQIVLNSAKSELKVMKIRISDLLKHLTVLNQ